MWLKANYIVIQRVLFFITHKKNALKNILECFLKRSGQKIKHKLTRILSVINILLVVTAVIFLNFDSISFSHVVCVIAGKSMVTICVNYSFN